MEPCSSRRPRRRTCCATAAAPSCSTTSSTTRSASRIRRSQSTPTRVMVLRNSGPVGYPGMAEVGNMGLPPAVLKQGITDMVRISDARMSGTAYGTVVLHVCPEAAVGGPLALVQDGDIIELDVEARRLQLEVSDEELARRRAAWQPPAPRANGGYVAAVRAARAAGRQGRGPRFPHRLPRPRDSAGIALTYEGTERRRWRGQEANDLHQFDLTGRRAVVTGGAQGFGRAIAERFLESGARVALWDIDATAVARRRASSRQGARSARRRSTSPAGGVVEAATAETVSALGASTSSWPTRASPAPTSRPGSTRRMSGPASSTRPHERVLLLPRRSFP